MKKLFSFALVTGIALTLTACVVPPHGGGGSLGGGSYRSYDTPQRPDRYQGARKAEAREVRGQNRPQQPNRGGNTPRHQPQKQPQGEHNKQHAQPSKGEPHKAQGEAPQNPKKPQGNNPPQQRDR